MNDLDLDELLRAGVPKPEDIKLLGEDDPFLRCALLPFNFETDARQPGDIDELIREALLRFDTRAIAANHFGLDVRVLAMTVASHPVVMFNPVISTLSPETVRMTETCLSFPCLYLSIARPAAVCVIYSDRSGARLSIKLYGEEARTLLRCIDHLNGVVFTDKVSRIRLLVARRRARRINRR